MHLELLKSKTGRTLVNHVILSGAKNPYCGGRALRSLRTAPSHRPDVLREGDIKAVNS
jgi:hypothetical protein